MMVGLLVVLEEAVVVDVCVGEECIDCGYACCIIYDNRQRLGIKEWCSLKFANGLESATWERYSRARQCFILFLRSFLACHFGT